MKNTTSDDEATSIYFTIGNDEKPIMKISNKKFYWKDEEIDDIHHIYERFNEWLVAAKLGEDKIPKSIT